MIHVVHVVSTPPLRTFICINAPEGCQRGTHTNETAYPLGTYASVHTQTHSSARQSTMRAHAVAGASPPVLYLGTLHLYIPATRWQFRHTSAARR